METQATKSLVELLAFRARGETGDTGYTFLLDGEGPSAFLSYRDLDRKAMALAYRLQGMGLQGGRALLLYPPGPDYIIGFFGCLYARVTAVPVYPPRMNRSLARLEAVARDAQAVAALTDSSILERFRVDAPADSPLKGMEWIATDAIPDNEASLWRMPEVESDDLAFLQYTSGSTGSPKGVMLSHGNLLANSARSREHFGCGVEAKGVVWLPPYHDMGLIGGILQPLYSGFPMTLMSPVSFIQKPFRWLRAITEAKATISGGPNFAYELCLQKIAPIQRLELDLSSWQVAFNGAEPVREDTLERFADYFRPCGFRREALHPCYGLAEGTLMASAGSPGRPFRSLRVASKALESDKVVTAGPQDDRMPRPSCSRTSPPPSARRCRCCSRRPRTRWSCCSPRDWPPRRTRCTRAPVTDRSQIATLCHRF